MPWTAVSAARIKAMLEERTLTEGTESTRQNPAQGFQARWLTEAREGETVSEANRKRVRSLRCCGNGPGRVPWRVTGSVRAL